LGASLGTETIQNNNWMIGAAMKSPNRSAFNKHLFVTGETRNTAVDSRLKTRSFAEDFALEHSFSTNLGKMASPKPNEIYLRNQGAPSCTYQG